VIELLSRGYWKLADVFLAIGPDHLFAAVLVFTWIGLTFAEHGRKLRRWELTLLGAFLTSAALSISCFALLVARLGGIPRFYTFAFFGWAVLAAPVSFAVVLWHLKVAASRGRRDVQP
jgi:hypothetical protein